MPDEINKDNNIQPVPQEGSSEKPLSPEAEIVAANQPKPDTAPVVQKPAEPKTALKTPVKKPSTQIGKDSAKPKNTSRFLMLMGLTLAGLFVLFVVLMVLMIASGGGQSPILSALGISDSGIKSFLLGIVNISFGLLAFIFFVLGVIGVFRILFAKKDDKDTKKKGLRMTIIGMIPLVLVMFIWMFLYQFINRIVISSQRIKAEILVTSPADITDLSAPLEVTFSSENVIKSLRNSGFSITGGSWDFNGDGKFETPITSDYEMSYLYNMKGTYNVGLEVNVNGEDTPRQYFFPLVIEKALFAANPSSGTAPLDVTFDATSLISKGIKVKSLDWDFDNNGTYDETGSDKLRVTHKFEQVGKYSVHLRIVYDNNLVDNFYRDMDVTASTEPLLSAGIDAIPGLSGQIPLQIRFDGEKSLSLKGNITKYEWDFGDGSQIQNGRTVSRVFDKPGTYNVTLTVTEDSGKTASTTVIVEAKAVSSVPVAGFVTEPSADANGKVNGESPLAVSFDASKSTDADNDIVEYSWDLGDQSSPQTGQKISYTYEKAGTYTVTLKVTDSQKQSSTATSTIEVVQPGVKAVITASPEEGTAPLSVNFDGSSSSAFDGNIVSYEWDFGDKSPKSITSAQITHKYNDVGNYQVTLKVTTNKNETGTVTKTIFVREIPLRACFTPSRRNGDAPLAVTFDSICSTGTVTKYSWDFSDGAVSDDRKPTHTFENPGTYNVNLEVTDDKSNVNTYSDVIVVTGELK